MSESFLTDRGGKRGRRARELEREADELLKAAGFSRLVNSNVEFSQVFNPGQSFGERFRPPPKIVDIRAPKPNTAPKGYVVKKAAGLCAQCQTPITGFSGLCRFCYRNRAVQNSMNTLERRAKMNAEFMERYGYAADFAANYMRFDTVTDDFTNVLLQLIDDAEKIVGLPITDWKRAGVRLSIANAFNERAGGAPRAEADLSASVTPTEP